MMDLGIDRIAERSDSVIRGDVLSRTSRWSTDAPTPIVTDVVVSVSEVIAGRGPVRGTVTIEVLGGEIVEEDIGLKVSDQPSFEVGEQAVLFLRKNMGRESYSTVANRLGKIPVDGSRVMLKGGPTDLSSFKAMVRDLPVGSRVGR